MQFQVPQFIDVENKIIGPLSLRQFLYLAGAGLISFMLFFYHTNVVMVFNFGFFNDNSAGFSSYKIQRKTTS